MVIIGINSSGYVTSAAIVVDGDLVFGCAEERLDRRKISRAFPSKAIHECLAYTGIKLSEVDCFAIGYNPGISIASRTRTGFSEWPGYPGARLFSNPNYLLPYFDDADFNETTQTFHRRNGGSTHIRYVTHHLAHASNAFILSNVQESSVFTCDGYGERVTTLWGSATRQGKEMDIYASVSYPHSIGSLYATITQLLGFSPDLDEWKVMGAAAYGDPMRFYPRLRQLILWEEGQPEFELDLSYFNFFDFDVAPMFRPKLERLLIPRRREGDPLTQAHFDLAAGIQKVTEDYLLSALNWLYVHNRQKNLCISGGVAMNSVFNGKASLQLPFERVFVPYAPDDNGNSIGAALWVAWQEGEIRGNQVNANPCLGRDYSVTEIEMILIKYQLKYTEVPDIAGQVARLVAEGKVVGWFQGRMEFGHRALGYRSILADPRRSEMKDKVNAAIKYREAFRPFALSILDSYSNEYFESDAKIQSPYMEKVLTIKMEKRDLIPAVVHEDGTSRLQTVSADTHPLFTSLIEEFYKRTDIPMVLNTSFNVSGEPIVASPSDAIRSFYSSGLDALAIGPFLLEKGK